MPPNRLLSQLVLGVVLLFAGGCTSPSSSSADDAYRPPAPGPEVAYLKGSNASEGGLFGADHRGFAFMVDLQSVPDAADRWNESLPLSAGHHTIGAEYRYSNFVARAHLPLEAKAGVTYQLMVRDGHEDGLDSRLYCEFWIADAATGRMVTQVYHRQVMGGKKGTIFNVNK